MHNCKRTRNVLLDLALDELPPEQASGLLAELDDCAFCQAEHAGVTSALRVSQQALRSVVPTEEFWPGYHSRLQAKLSGALNDANEHSLSEVKPMGFSFGSRLWNVLGVVTTSSVRVPLPAALAVLLLVGVLSFTALSRGQSTETQATPFIPAETRTVHVPVIQERIITQVVYVKKKERRHNNVQSPASANLTASDVTAANGKPAFSLVGFKPADQVNLTITKGSIKGTNQDEK